MSKKRRNTTAENAKKDQLFALQGYHYRAVELRYEGRTYKDICGFLGVEMHKAVHPDTIAKWFGKNGLLSEEYMTYSHGENDRRRKLMQEELKKLVMKIPGKLEKLIDRLDQTGQPDMTALIAIKTLAEFVGLSPDNLAGTGNKMDEYFERLEKAPSLKEPVKV